MRCDDLLAHEFADRFAIFDEIERTSGSIGKRDSAAVDSQVMIDRRRDIFG